MADPEPGPKPEPKSVILSGGGAKIFAHVGYLMKHWDGKGYSEEITHFSGSSAGAIVGVFAAIGCSPQRIKEILEENLINLFTPEDFKQVLNEEIKKQIDSIKGDSIKGDSKEDGSHAKDYTFADLEDLAKEFPKRFKHFTAAVTVHKATLNNTDDKIESSKMSRLHKPGSTIIFSSEESRSEVIEKSREKGIFNPMNCSIADVVLGSSAVPVVLPPMKIREVESTDDEEKGLTLEVYDGDYGGRRGTEENYKVAMGMGEGKQFYAHNLFEKDFSLLFARMKAAFLQWAVMAGNPPKAKGVWAYVPAQVKQAGLLIHALYNISSRTAVKTVNYDLSRDSTTGSKVKTAEVKGLQSFNFLASLENIASVDSLILHNLPDDNIARRLLDEYQKYKNQQKKGAQQTYAEVGNYLNDEKEKEKYVLYAINKIALDVSTHNKAKLLNSFIGDLTDDTYKDKLAGIFGIDATALKEEQKEYYKKNTGSYNELYEKLRKKIPRLFESIPAFKKATIKEIPGSGAEPAPAPAAAPAPAQSQAAAGNGEWKKRIARQGRKFAPPLIVLAVLAIIKNQSEKVMPKIIEEGVKMAGPMASAVPAGGVAIFGMMLLYNRRRAKRLDSRLHAVMPKHGDTSLLESAKNYNDYAIAGNRIGIMVNVAVIALTFSTGGSGLLASCLLLNAILAAATILATLKSSSLERADDSKLSPGLG